MKPILTSQFTIKETPPILNLEAQSTRQPLQPRKLPSCRFLPPQPLLRLWTPQRLQHLWAKGVEGVESMSYHAWSVIKCQSDCTSTAKKTSCKKYQMKGDSESLMKQYRKWKRPSPLTAKSYGSHLLLLLEWQFLTVYRWPLPTLLQLQDTDLLITESMALRHTTRRADPWPVILQKIPQKSRLWTDCGTKYMVSFCRLNSQTFKPAMYSYGRPSLLFKQVCSSSKELTCLYCKRQQALFLRFLRFLPECCCSHLLALQGMPSWGRLHRDSPAPATNKQLITFHQTTTSTLQVATS